MTSDEPLYAAEGGSHGSQRDGGGYRSHAGTPDVGASSSTGGRSEAGGGGDGAAGSFGDLLAEAEERRRRREERRKPQLWLPGSADLDTTYPAEPGTEFATDLYQGTKSCQVGVRLRPRHFERLARAAEIYGVRPTTLARMMVMRGVNAILDSELRRDRGLLSG